MKKKTTTKKTKTTKTTTERVMEMSFEGKAGMKATLLITANKKVTANNILEILITAKDEVNASVLRAHAKAVKTGQNKFYYTEGA